ncbi:MAG: DUF1501 domain-containing protein [Acidobacteria bacterium]|nr:DUF1501 domain-containing protein [Acidobacteriota bacterium]
MSNQTLVIINLRGGADGLNIVVPYKEENYYRIRPTISLLPPNKPNGVIDLDGFFGMHPALAQLLPLYEHKELAFLHAVGWPGKSHSHFEAWEEIELGIANTLEKPLTGWLTRFLELTTKDSSPLQTINFSSWPSKLFIGCQGVNQITQLSDFCLITPNKLNNSNMLASLKSLYSQKSLLGQIGQRTINAIEEINKILERKNKDSSYPKTKLGSQIQSVAELINAQVGLKAVSLDLNGWDTHIMQGGAKGHMANLLLELASAISAFAKDLKDSDKWKNVLVVVMTEFGRRAMENASSGTEHGQGGVMFFAGGNINGGRVYGDWPGLSDEQLSQPGDLAITTDFRQALSEFIIPKVGLANITKIFPAYQINKQVGILAS